MKKFKVFLERIETYQKIVNIEALDATQAGQQAVEEEIATPTHPDDFDGENLEVKARFVQERHIEDWPWEADNKESPEELNESEREQQPAIKYVTQLRDGLDIVMLRTRHFDQLGLPESGRESIIDQLQQTIDRLKAN